MSVGYSVRAVSSIPSGFTDDWSAFAGNRRFIDRGHAFNDLSVTGDDFSRPDQDHIAFDMAWDVASPPLRRVILLLQAGLFCVLFAVAIPTVVDYILFLWRERTDAMLLRLDYVYSIFPFFFAVVLLRLALVVRELAGAGWRRELARWSGEEES